MHGVLLRPDGYVVAVPHADHDDIHLPGGSVYRGIPIVDAYGQHYWVYVLAHDPLASGVIGATKI